MKQQETRRRHSYNCSFCGTSQDLANRLIAGPGGVYVCDACIDLIQRGNGAQLEDKNFFYASSKESEKKVIACNFCGKRVHQTSYHVGSNLSDGVLICDECVDLCREIIDEEQSHAAPHHDPTSEGSQTGKDS